MRPPSSRHLFTLLGAALLSALLHACATVPGIGRSQLMLVDEREAAQLGLSQFEQMKEKVPLSHDPQEIALVRSIGERIARVVALPYETEWEFVVFDQPDTPNAFALPGGKVGVFNGILPIADHQAARLAAVIGHEVAHVVARHGSERMSQGLLVELGGQVLSTALRTEPGLTQQLAMTAYGLGSEIGVLLPYSRKHELEADRLGMMYMAQAGYDPREAIEFWKSFARYSAEQGGQPVEFLSTHPLDATRVRELERFLPEALEAYNKQTGAINDRAGH